MREKVYILGGSGFVGKHLSVFLSTDYDVTVFDKWIDEDYFSKFSQINICKLDLIKEQIPLSYSVPLFIINTASSLVTASRNMDEIGQLIADDTNILMNIFNRFANQSELKLFVQFGSVEEYGTAKSPFDESQREEPNSTYALLKQTTSNLAKILQINYNFPSTVVRPGNLFGLYQSKQRFISYVYNNLSENKELKVTGCEQKRDFIYIDEFVKIISKILLNYQSFVGEIVNVSSGKSTRLMDIIEQLKELLHSDSIIHYGKIPYRENESMNFECRIEKLERLLNEKINININKNLIEYMEQMLTQNKER